MPMHLGSSRPPVNFHAETLEVSKGRKSPKNHPGRAPGVQQAVGEHDVAGGVDALAAPCDGRPHRPRRHAPLLLAALDGALEVKGLRAQERDLTLIRYIVLS